MTTPGDRDSPVGPIVLARSLPWQRVKVTFPFFYCAYTTTWNDDRFYGSLSFRLGLIE